MKILITRCLVAAAVLGCAMPALSESRASWLAKAERALGEGDYTTGVEAYVSAAASSDNIETARQAALTAYDFGFDTLATTAAERWLELDEDALEPRLYQAMSVLRQGDRKRALALWKRIFSSAENTQRACDFVEEEMTGRVRADDAAWLFDALAAQFLSERCVILQAAVAAAGADEIRQAEQWLARLEKLDAFDDDARLLRIALLIDADSADEAFTDDSLRLSDDATVEQQVRLALLNARADDIENASNLLELLREEAPDNASVLEAMALVQLQAGEVEASRESFLALLDTGEKIDSAMYYLARFAEGQRRFEQALRLYTQIDYGDYVVDAQQRAAYLLSERGTVLDAVDHLEGFTRRHPRFGLDLSLVRASLYAQNEYFDQALELYDAFLKIKPRAEFALLGRADTLLRRGDIDDAISAFRAVVELYPESANALNSLGYTLADRTRKYKEAERLIDKALEIEPDNAAFIDSKGWVLFRRGKLKAAREQLEIAYEQFPDAEVAAHLGEVMWRMGDEEAARSLLQEAYRRDPEDKTLRDTIRRLMEDGPATRS